MRRHSRLVGTIFVLVARRSSLGPRAHGEQMGAEPEQRRLGLDQRVA